MTLNGDDLLQDLPAGNNGQIVMSFLSSLEGYNLAQGGVPVTVVQGRNLNASDAGSNNILISQQLTTDGALDMDIEVGDKITFASEDGKISKTATVVGIYSGNESGADHTGSVLAAGGMVKALAPAKIGVITVTYMKIDPAHVNKALNTIGNLVPNATVENLSDVGSYFAQQLNSIIDILVAIASLSLIAGVIIIANAVALAMLERRRELGILKAVGYTSETVLSEVMIENGVIGVLGGLLAVLLVIGVLALIGTFLFNLTLQVSALIVVGLIGGSALLAMLTAALVAASSVRLRPLEVLRYE